MARIRENLERTQKSFAKLDLKEKVENYQNAMLKLNLEILEDRRAALCLKFAKAGIKNKKLHDLLPEKGKDHKMEKISNDKVLVQFANTDRLRKSSIIKISKN